MTLGDATAVLVLDRGRVVDEGVHPELLSPPGQYAELHRLYENELPRVPRLSAAE